MLLNWSECRGAADEASEMSLASEPVGSPLGISVSEMGPRRRV